MNSRIVPGAPARSLLRIATLLWASWLIPLPASSAIILVNGTSDALADDGICTLREAVIAANTNTGSGSRREGECARGDPLPLVDVIVFVDPPGSPDVFALAIPGPGGFLELDATKGDLDVTESLWIAGNGYLPSVATVIDANQIDRVFQIAPGVTLTMTQLGVRNGKAADWGGGVLNLSGSLRLDRVSINQNEAEAGGGIYNDSGALEIHQSSVSSNFVTCSHDNCAAAAGGIAVRKSAGPVTIELSHVTGNRVTCIGDNCLALGAGIEHDGFQLILNGVLMSSNESRCDGQFCRSEGGGIYNRTTVELEGSLLYANRALGSSPPASPPHCRGGGIRNDGGWVSVSDTRLELNAAGCDLTGRGDGGGIFTRNGTVTVKNGSRLTQNAASYGGGAIWNDGSTVYVREGALLRRNRARLAGGGIYADGSPFANGSGTGYTEVTDSTLDQNRTEDGGFGGGIYNFAVLAVSRSTLSRNGAMGFDGKGGAIYNGWEMEIVNSTFSGNFATGWGAALINPGNAVISFSTFYGNTRGVPGLAAGKPAGGAVYNAGGGELEMKSVIVAHSISTFDCVNSGTLVASGSNLDSDGSCAFSLTAMNPLLDVLLNNGGPTDTHALLTGSPAIDAALDCTDTNFAPVSTDQRGALRPVAATCDLGAYEGGGVVFGGDLSKIIAALTASLQARFEAPLREMARLVTDGNPSNDRAACGKLGAFLNLVIATERRGQLTRDEAAVLRQAAAALQSALACDTGP